MNYSTSKINVKSNTLIKILKIINNCTLDETDKLTRPFFRILGTNYKNYQIQYSCTYNNGKYMGSEWFVLFLVK